NQVPYLDALLQHFNLLNVHKTSTPLPAGYKPVPHDGNPDPKLRHRLQTMIGSLLWIMLGTRHDIAFAVTKLPQFAVNPSQVHMDKALHICQYLLGTKDYKLVYDGKTERLNCLC